MYDAHPAIGMSMRTRIDYARVVASIASADNSIDAGEMASLRGLCSALGLPPGATQGVLVFAKEPNPAHVRDAVEAIRDTDLALTLVTDLVAMAMSDGKYDISERKQIHAVAALLLVGEAEIAAIEDYVAHSLEGHEVITDFDPATTTTGVSLVRRGGEVAASLVAACVPLAMVWAFSPRGISVVGVTKALETLGFGFGAYAGVAVAVGSGLFSYLATRVLFDVVVGVSEDDI